MSGFKYPTKLGDVYYTVSTRNYDDVMRGCVEYVYILYYIQYIYIDIILIIYISQKFGPPPNPPWQKHAKTNQW